METLNNSKNINYSFIAVPTQLFILLDYRLKLVLTSLIQVSTALANSNGWFFYSKEDLKKLCGIKNDKTIIACLETFYRLNLLEVQARTFKNNVGSRTANYYRINFSEIEKYNEYSVYECLNINELQISMLDYTSKDYQTTYTASTEPSNEVAEEMPSNDTENVSEGQKTSNPELDEIDEDCPLTQDELQEHLEYTKTPIEKRMMEWKELEDDLAFLNDKEDEEKIAESATESVKVDNEVIETASVMPTDLNRVEKRSIYTNEKTEKLDESVKQKCAELVQRYVEMVIPSANESADKCNAALRYILDKYNKGYIDIETKDRLSRELINARFMKHSI